MKNKSNIFPPKPTSISASISIPIPLERMPGSQKNIAKWQKCKDRFVADTERLEKAAGRSEFLGIVKDILPFWLNESQSYRKYIISYMRHLAVEYGLELMPEDLLGIQFWIKKTEQGKSDVIDLYITKDQVEILSYLCEEPTVRLQCEINAYLKDEKSKKTLKKLLDVMVEKKLISRPPTKQKGWIATRFGKDFYADNYC